MGKIIMSLPTSFRHFTSAWDSVPSAEKTITLLTSRLVKEEKMNKLQSNGQPNVAEGAYFAGQLAPFLKPMTQNHPQQQPYVHPSGSRNARGTYRGGFRGEGRGCGRGGRGFNGRPYFTCHYCGAPGHRIADCRKRKKAENDPGESKVNHYGHFQDFGYSSLSSICFAARRNFDWYADSGATHHMTDQRSTLWNFEPVVANSWSVEGIGGVKLFVHGKWDIHLTSKVNGKTLRGTIREVLYVPDIGTNLFSIGNATKTGSEVFF